jgi:RNA ligase (TIGR02306 family)
MSGFAVKVVEIINPVEHHPNADRLSLIRIGGYTCVSGKLEDGSHRYKVGDLVVYVPEGAVVPDYLLKPGFWNEKEDKGGLGGAAGNRVTPLKLRGIFSQGILFEVEDDGQGSKTLLGEDGTYLFVKAGTDVTAHLGITKYEPPIPDELLGSVFNLFGTTHGYDFESVQALTDMFEPGERVSVTEKIHGFNTQIGYVPGLNNADCFGADKCIYLSSKGLAAQGLAFKDVEDNVNIYVNTLRALIADGFDEKLKAFSERTWGPSPVRLFVEIYGGQDLKYGKNKGEPGLAMFDLYTGDKPSGRFATRSELEEAADLLGIQCVPLLYEGPYDPEVLVTHRDGKDTFTGAHIREGIVIKSANPTGAHIIHGRKIAKWVSPDYLLRKGGTEFN